MRYLRLNPVRGSWRAALLAVLVVALLGVAVPSSAGVGAGEFLTVTPTTGLVTGDTIQIDADHGDSAFSGVGICRSGTSYGSLLDAISNCFTIESVGGPTYSISHIVQQSVVMNGAQVDCAVLACSVFLYGGDGAFNTTLVLEQPLQIDPSDPIDPFLTVNPSTGLEQGDVIQIEAHDGGSVVYSGVGICPAGSSFTSVLDASAGCRTLLLLGGPVYSITHPVERVLTIDGSPLDCAPSACSVFLFGGDASFAISLQLEVPLAFELTPFLIANPTVGLEDAETVDVTWTGGEAGVTSTVVQCVRVDDAVDPEVAPNGCVDLGPATGTPPDLQASVSVQRWIDDGDGLEHDCADTTAICLIGIRHGNGAPHVYAFTAVTFSAEVTFTLTPHPGTLRDGDPISVHGTNIDKDLPFVGVQKCVRDTSPWPGVLVGCVDTAALLDTTPGSTHDATFPVSRFVSLDGATYDCAQTIFAVPGGLGRCFFELRSFDSATPGAASELIALQLGILRAVPPLEVIPDSDLQRTQTVDVFLDQASADPGWAGVCPVINDVRSIDWAERSCEGGPLAPWSQGHSFSATVNRAIQTTQFGRIDCVSDLVLATGGCEFVVLAGPDPIPPALLQARVGLGFEKSLSFDHAIIVQSGSEIPVELVGWPSPPGSAVIVAQCGFQFPISYDSFRCRFAGPVHPDFNGDYTGTATVERFIETEGEPPIDCENAFPFNCAIIVGLFDGMTPYAVPGSILGVFDELPPFP